MSEFLTTTDLARRLGVPVHTIHYWRSTRTGPRGAKVGKRVLYRWADVEAWFDQRVIDDPVNEDPKYRTVRR